MTIRLPKHLAEWLEETACRIGVSKSQIVCEALEKVRTAEMRPFIRLAGAGAGPRDLSTRKGFSRK